MRRLLRPIVLLVIGGAALAGCVIGTPTSPVSGNETPAAAAAIPNPEAGWEQKWKTVLSEAKQEGTASIYSIWRPETRIALSQAFKDRYGINVEFSPFGRGTDLIAKVKAEQRAGIYAADIFGAGNTTLIATMKPEGLLGPIEPLLILPEVSDPKAWIGGRVPFTDDQGMALSLIGQVTRNLVYNTEFVKEGELTSYKDLLRPQYKGKITLSDPTVPGAGNSSLAYLTRVWGEAETRDFLRRLIKEQEVVIQRDSRLHIETIARGKYTLGMGPLTDVLFEFMGVGAPLKLAMPKEDVSLTASAGAFGVPTKRAHYNATIVFVNWLLTKEGQSLFSKSFGSPSTRLDASTQGLSPLMVPVPGEKYYLETEEFQITQGKWMEINKRIIEEAAK